MNIISVAANMILFQGAHVLGALFRWDYMTKAHKGTRVSEKALKHILNASRNTEYGKRCGFSSIKTVADYQKAVPLSTYDDYQPYIERMVNGGERNLITARKISYYATSSGTLGQTKLLPQAANNYLPIFKIVCIMGHDVGRAARQKGLHAGPVRGLITTEIHMKPVDEKRSGRPGQAHVGGISSYAAAGMKLILPIFTPLPKEAFDGEIHDLRYIKARYTLQDPGLKWFGAPFMSAITDVVTYMIANREMLIRDIETGTIDASIEMSEKARKSLERKLRPDPKRAAELREIFAAPSDDGILAKVWKNLACVISVGAGDFAPFTKKMLRWCGEGTCIGYSCYTASEAWMGYAFRFNDPSYLLLLDGNFYEFLPVGEDGKADTERPLLMAELEVGKYYEIVITNQSGLYRYRIRDVVKITGFEGETPYMEFAYRANRATDLCGAHINDEFVAAATAAVEKELGLRIEDYSLYADTEAEPPRIVMFMEPERPVDGAERKRMQETFEAAMVKGGRGYRLAREAGNLAPCAVNTVAPGTYLAYRQKRIAAGASENQLKSIRVIRPGKEYEFFLSAVEADAPPAEVEE